MNKRLIRVIGPIIFSLFIGLGLIGTASAASNPTTQTVASITTSHPASVPLASVSQPLNCYASLQDGGFDHGLQSWTSFSDSPGSHFDLTPDVDTHVQGKKVSPNAHSAHISNVSLANPVNYYAYFGLRSLPICSNQHELWTIAGKYEALGVTLNPDPTDGHLDPQGNSLVAGINLGATSADPNVAEFSVLDHMTQSISGTVSWDHGLPKYSKVICTGNARAFTVEARMGTTSIEPRFGLHVGHGGYGSGEFDELTATRTGRYCLN